MQHNHPRDKFITVYGKKPVMEVLENKSLEAVKCFSSMKRTNPFLKEIERKCKNRGISLELVDGKRLAKISKNEKQNQGVAVDVLSPKKMSAPSFFDRLHPDKNAIALVFDGVTTPANVGLIIRTSTGLGIDAIFLPRKGSPSISPLIIKASAGTIFSAPIVSCATPESAIVELKQNGFKVYGLDGSSKNEIQSSRYPKKVAIVLGNETVGLSPKVINELDDTLSIPCSIESLNVACAASIACWELTKRKLIR